MAKTNPGRAAHSRYDEGEVKGKEEQIFYYVNLDLAPQPPFPDVKTPKPERLNSREQSQLAHFFSFRQRVRDGPSYAIIGHTSNLESYGSFEAAQFDPFEGLPTYSSRYQKKKRTLPQLNSRSYDAEFFPPELYSILRIKAQAAANGLPPEAADSKVGKGKRKLDEEEDALEETLPKSKKQHVADNGNGESSSARRPNSNVVDESDDDDENQEDDEGAEVVNDSDQDEDEVDDAFSDDDDDDYNAEQYFDDGGDEYDDGGGDDGEGRDDTY